MDVLVTPGMSNLTKLSALHLSGTMGNYEAIGTFKFPDLQQLVLRFGGVSQDQDLPEPVLPLFNTGGLLGLTKLEIGSSILFEQVDALPRHVTIHKECAFNENFDF